MTSEWLDTVHHVDALTLLRKLPDSSVDAVITDPPYAEVSRDYGRFSEDEWMSLMQACVDEFRRVLTPAGSAMLVLQPNNETHGKMRLWLWKFLVWCGEHWNLIQDVYWWNYTAMPTSLTHRDIGLLKPSIKYCVWCGSSNCYRDQGAVLSRANLEAFASKKEKAVLQYYPSGAHTQHARMYQTVMERGGSVPMNILPIANANSVSSGGAHGHGAATPYRLVEWWIRYISRPNEVVLDPFIGSGTTALAARNLGRHYIGCDSSFKHISVARERLAQPYTLSLDTLISTQ